MLLSTWSCTSTRSARVHGVSETLSHGITLQSCPKTISVVNGAAKTSAFSNFEKDDVLNIAVESVERQLKELTVDQVSADLELTVLKAYVNNMATSKSVVVVMKLQSVMLEQEVILRGTHTGVNWWATKNEYQNSLKVSFNTALGELKKSLITACQTTDVSSI